MRLFIRCLLVSLTISAHAQETLSQLSGQVYPPPTNTNQQSSNGNQGGFILDPASTGDVSKIGNGTSVPYYLRKNNTVMKDGLGIIDIRTPRPFPGSIERITKPEATVPPLEAHRKSCGIRNPDDVGFRITGFIEGEAQFGEFPWMAAIFYEEKVESQDNVNTYQCGGALIHPEVVVTAAHCISGKKDGKFWIRAGEWDIQTAYELFPHQDRDVKKTILHEGFRPGTLYNDVALLFLESPVNITENVNTVCLPPRGTISNSSTCYAMGWGKDVFGSKGKYQNILKKIELPMIAVGECQAALRKTRLGVHFELHNTFTCAGGEPGKDTCEGDGGSPLVCPIPGQKNRYQQMGIVSWGIGCGNSGIPGVYANIAELRDWVDNKMAAEGFDSKEYSY